MVLSNAERQARHRAKLKAAASTPPSIRELLTAFFREHPDECGEGANNEAWPIEVAVEVALESLVTFRLQLDHWQELYPDADLAALRAMFAGVEPPPPKRRNRKS